MQRFSWLVVLLTLTACGHDEILHGLDEVQANEAMVALADAGIAAAKRRDETAEGSWRVEVASPNSAAAQRLLAARGLPRRGQPGFGEVFGKGSIVPTASEERALYLHALSGELARTIESIDGVVEARVHLALPPQDALRLEAAPPARAAVLLKARAGTRGRLDPLAPGIQSLVAGAVAGLDASAVAVVIAEAMPAALLEPSRAPRRGTLLASAAGIALLALAVPAAFASRRFVPRARLKAMLGRLRRPSSRP